ncbi:hypothetical protein [Pseudomonas sp. Fl5BN2]|uniref:hypothetical protein n=1 Tax=Pseudomonas sp. Fl5BN2 TaxID=2697652 RepID=UPI002114B0C6|nr:hypothetical protein [Pseudomonas sp. Fl5BN2]
MIPLNPGDFAGTGKHKHAPLLAGRVQGGSWKGSIALAQSHWPANHQPPEALSPVRGKWKGFMLRAGLVGLLAFDPLLCIAQTAPVKQQPSPATLPGKTPDRESAASASVAATPGDQAVAVDATCNLPVKPSPGKVVEIYWTQGLENRRVVGREADHYVDLNLIVRTVGFRPGECIEATIRGENDADEIADTIKKIVLRGKVNDEGIAYFKTPLKDYTLNLQGNEAE